MSSDAMGEEAGWGAGGIPGEERRLGRLAVAGSHQACSGGRSGRVRDVGCRGDQGAAPLPGGAAERAVDVLGDPFVAAVSGLARAAAGMRSRVQGRQGLDAVVVLRRLGDVEVGTPRLAEPGEEQRQQEGPPGDAAVPPSPVARATPHAPCDSPRVHGCRG